MPMPMLVLCYTDCSRGHHGYCHDCSSCDTSIRVDLLSHHFLNDSLEYLIAVSIVLRVVDERQPSVWFG